MVAEGKSRWRGRGNEVAGIRSRRVFLCKVYDGIKGGVSNIYFQNGCLGGLKCGA